MPPRGRAPLRPRAGHPAGPPAAAAEPAGGRPPEWHARVTEQADTLCRTASDLLARRGASLPRAELRRARAAAVWLCDQVLDDMDDGLNPGVHATCIHALLWLPPRRRVGLVALLAVGARALASADPEGPTFQDHLDLHFGLARMFMALVRKAAGLGSGPAAPGQQVQQWAALREAAMAAVAFAVGPMQLLHVYSRLLGAPGPRRPPPQLRTLAGTTAYVLLKLLDVTFARSRAPACGGLPAPSGGSSAAGAGAADAGAPGAAAGQDLGAGRERALGMLLGLSSSSLLEHTLRDTLVSSLAAGAEGYHAAMRVYTLLMRTSNLLAAAAEPGQVPQIELYEQCRASCGRTAEAARAVLSGPCLQYTMAAHAVAQLAAADGGRVYGIAAAALMPYVAASDGLGRPKLCIGGLSAAMRMWSWCLQQGVPLVAVSRRAVHELALRLLAVLTACAAEGRAHQEQVGQAHTREQAAGAAPSGSGGGSSGHAAGSEPHAASSCFARAGASGASGSGGAAGTIAAAGPAARGGVVRALADCPGLAMDALRCASLSARHPPVLYGESWDGRWGAQGRLCSPAPGSPALAAAACRFWGAAVPVLGAELERAVAGSGCWPSVRRVMLELTVAVPDWPASGAPDPAPPPNLAAALAAGYLPLLERTIRAATRITPGCNAGVAAMLPLLHWWPLVGRLQSYGAPHEAAALVATVAKVMRTLLPPAAASSSSSSSSSNAAMGDALDQSTIAISLRNLLFLSMNKMMATMAAYATAQRSAGWALHTGAGAGAAYSAGPPRPPLCVGPPAGTEAAEAWARGPSLQLLHRVHLTLRLWLPAGAQAAAAMLRLLGGLGPGAADLPPSARDDASQVAGVQPENAAHAACAVLQWVPALLHASARAATAQVLVVGGAAAATGEPGHAAAASPFAGAAVWRDLVLDEMDALELIGSALEVVLPEVGDPMADQLEAVRAPLICLAAAFPGEVAAALRDGRLPPRCLSLLPDSGLAAELAREGRRVAAGPGGKRCAPVPGIACRPLPDVTSRHGCWVNAGEVGAALLASAEAPAGWPAEPPACSNPRCANLAGRSEAELPLLACSACGTARYCGPGCQRAHWARHKQACRARGGG